MDIQESNELRARAEALISSGQFDKSDFQGDVQEILQELNIYMAELEAQNDELNQAYVCIEEQSRDNFALFEHAPIAYCVLSDDHRVLKLNKRCRELFIDKGTTQKQFLPIVYKTIQQSTDIYSWLFDDKQPTLTVHFSNEPDEWHLLEKKPYHSNQKLIAITDITAQINTQTRLQEQSQEAQQANDAKAQFLASMSHEIRTPLTGIMGFIDLLGDEELSDSAHKKLDRIKESANSLLRILNDVQDISKLNAQQLSVDYSDFDLYKLVADTTSQFNHERETDNLAYNIKLDNDIPQFIHSDESKVQQILSNLLRNASKYTESGEINVQVSLLDGDPVQIKILIEDTGIGINASDIDELFEEFSQDNSNLHRKYHGTGLGLAISQKLADALGGSIGASKRESVGSRFWFTIPLKVASAPVIDNIVTNEPLAGKPLTILVADDNRTNQMIMKAMLEKMNHYVDVVENGQEAVDAYHEKDYDLIIMDSHMPVMTGYQATQVIRSSIKDQPRQIPIFSWTADGRHEHLNHILSIGMNELLSKPIDRQELEQKITQVSLSPASVK